MRRRPMDDAVPMRVVQRAAEGDSEVPLAYE